jgi:hypothetical protein
MTMVRDSPGFDAVRSTSTQGSLGQLLLDALGQLLFDLRADAPGHRVRTTMTLKVKSGSSARPSWK